MAAAQWPATELLAETEWLWAHRTDTKLRIIDTRSPEAYAAGHIPHAVALGIHPWLKGKADPLHVLGADEFGSLMESLGVSNEMTVISYSDHNGLSAARLWWVLRYYGHRTAKVLNGGWDRWTQEGRPVTTESFQPQSMRFEPRPDIGMNCDFGELRDRLSGATVQILDVRSDKEWSGDANPQNNPRVGHIPGAHHLEWTALVDPARAGAFRSKQEIRDLLARAGIHQGEVVVHCQAGVRAAHTAFALSLAEWDHVRVYDGSMAEWSRHGDASLITEK